jgi:hypothetical protein
MSPDLPDGFKFSSETSSIALSTGDAHDVYRRFGLEPLPSPERWMSIEAAKTGDPRGQT